MNDVVVELGVESIREQTAFSQAVELFANWRAETAAETDEAGEAPDLIVKTTCSGEGNLAKKLIFQDPDWAGVFMGFWQSELQRV